MKRGRVGVTQTNAPLNTLNNLAVKVPDVDLDALCQESVRMGNVRMAYDGFNLQVAVSRRRDQHVLMVLGLMVGQHIIITNVTKALAPMARTFRMN